MATMKVEAWCEREFYAWNWFASCCGTNIESKMVSVSPLFSDILSGRFEFKLPCVHNITPASVTRDVPYFLRDGINPLWPIFEKPIHWPDTHGEESYNKHQEAIRKDIERYFGVFQASF